MGIDALGALLIGEFNQQDGVLRHQAHEQHQADAAEQIQVHCRNDRQHARFAAEVKQPQQTKRADRRERHGENDRQRMDQALELRGEHHIDDDQRQDQHQPDFLAGVAQVARFAGPGVKKPGRQIGAQQLFDTQEHRAQRHADRCARDGGAAHPVVMLDLVGRGADLVTDHTAELDQVAGGVANVEPVEVLRCEPRFTAQLGHHVIFLAADLDAAEVQSAEQDLQRARNVLHRDAQRGGAVAVDVEPQLRFVDFEGTLQVDEHRFAIHLGLLELVHQLTRVTIQRLEVLRLDGQLKRRAETAGKGLGNLRKGEGALDLAQEACLQTARPFDDFLHGAFAVLLEVDEGDALVGLARAGHRQRDDGAEQLDFGRLPHDVLDLLDHAAGVFAGGALGGDDK